MHHEALPVLYPAQIKKYKRNKELHSIKQKLKYFEKQPILTTDIGIEHTQRRSLFGQFCFMLTVGFNLEKSMSYSRLYSQKRWNHHRPFCPYSNP